MPHLIEVAFKGNRKEFFLWEADEPPPLKAAVIVDADRGEDLGLVHALGELAAKRNAGHAARLRRRRHDEEGAAPGDARTTCAARTSCAHRTRTRAARPWSA